jgi:hypothetical protein
MRRPGRLAFRGEDGNCGTAQGLVLTGVLTVGLSATKPGVAFRVLFGVL